jgi:hypothetical protein
MQSLSWPARLDNTPTSLDWSAVRPQPSVDPVRLSVTLAHTPTQGATAVEIARLSHADITLLLAAIADQLDSLELGMVQSGSRIDTTAGDTLTVMGRLAPALRVNIRIERSGRSTQILALDPSEIHQAIATIRQLRQSCALS